jgi:ribonuclease HII
VVGIDEVGRGPWAGPVVACAVSLDLPIEGLKDSKKLSAKKREELDEIIRKSSTFGLGWVQAEEIDEIGLTEAVRLAMQRAYQECGAKGQEIVVDGSINYLEDIDGSRAEIKAEDKYAEVAAASIVAKVARDKFMNEQSKIYPDYGFDQHVGYGTKQHKEALMKQGITPLHRRSFKPIKELL